jgi:glycosyltransferase involved in cell wall biosynthesis
VRILHFSVWARTFPRFRMPLLERQLAAGHEVEVACPPEPPYGEMIEAAGVRVHTVAMPTGGAPLATLRGIATLARLIRRRRPDLLHVHQPMGALIGIPAGRMAGVPTIFYTTGGFKSHPGMRPAVRMAVTAVERALFRRTRAVFSVNREDLEYARVHRVVSPEKIFYAGPRGGCGIDTRRYHPLPSPAHRAALRAELGLPVAPDAPVVGIVARIVMEKGFRELVRAFAAVRQGDPRARLVIVGEGPEMAELVAQIAAHGLQEAVVLLGNRLDVPQLLRTFDLFVLPSYREGMPVALLEAMASGLPVVATDVRGSREVVDPGRNGLLVPLGDVPALADALRRVLVDPEMAARMGREGHGDVLRHYGEEVVLDAHLRLYEQLAWGSAPASL